MIHLLLLIYLICLILVTLAASYSQQYYKIYKNPFLHSFVRYLIFLNLTIFLYLLVKYLWINFPESQFTDPQSTSYTIFLLLVSFAFIGWIYFFIRMSLELVEKVMTQNKKILLKAGISIICINYLIGLTILLVEGSNYWIIFTYRGLMLISGLVFLTTLIIFVFQKRLSQNNQKHKSIKAWGWISLVGYILVYTFSYLPEPIGLFTTSAGLLLLNIGHIIWLRTYFLRHYVSFSDEPNQQFLESFFQQYQISNREQEILQLLMQGKSNKEIESSLYISYNTVKNHIYNLYQKLGVNSRWQMLHLVMKERDQQTKPAT